jgi:hypothetical protein
LKARSWRLGFGGSLNRVSLQTIYQQDPSNPLLYSVILFALGGSRTAFVQDADSLFIKSADLVEILKHLREKFPGIERVTSYARSRTVAKKEIEELKAVRAAGLDRLHIGMESGSDQVLELVKKGATREEVIEAGTKAKAAGFELSEYVMPGLGGKKLSREHAEQTADALNRINPEFIRLRSLAVSPRSPLYEFLAAKQFEPLDDLETVREIRLFISLLDGISSNLVSDHVLNLLPELEGKFPADKPRLLEVCDRFLSLPDREQMVYIIGRRAGIFEALSELEDSGLHGRAEAIAERLDLHDPAQAREVVQKLMENFI